MYSQENIENIRRAGHLDAYIKSARDLINRLENTTINIDHSGFVYFGRLWGRYDVDVNTPSPHDVVASSPALYGWEGRWRIADFGGDQERALTFAQAALSTQFITLAAKVLADTRKDLVVLEAGNNPKTLGL